VSSSSKQDLDNTFEGDNVFDNTDSSPVQYKHDEEDKLSRDNEMQPFGDFGTFKTPEPSRNNKPAKGNRVTDDINFDKLEEKDEFDDPFNQFGTNEYEFKK